eukprot:scaffold269550_cov24-Tisochrysis_lutea.AAC.1
MAVVGVSPGVHYYLDALTNLMTYVPYMVGLLVARPCVFDLVPCLTSHLYAHLTNHISLTW